MTSRRPTEGEYGSAANSLARIAVQIHCCRTHRYAAPASAVAFDDPDSQGPLATSEMSVKLKRLAAILEDRRVEPAQNFDDHSALAWISQSLEDIEATVIGLAQSSSPQSSDVRRQPPSAESLASSVRRRPLTDWQ